MKLSEIIEALNQGQTVNWSNTSYKVHFVEIDKDNEYQNSHFTRQGSQVLRVSHTTSYFGSLLSESELSNCFVQKKGS